LTEIAFGQFQNNLPTLTPGQRPSISVNFSRHIGIDYAGAETPTSRLRALQVFACRDNGEPVKVTPPAEGARNWTRFEVAQLCGTAIETGESIRTIDKKVNRPHSDRNRVTLA